MYIYATVMMCSFVYLSLIAFIYYRRKKIASNEINIFNKIIATSLFSVVFELLSCFFVYKYQDYYIPAIIVNKLYISTIFVWNYYFTMYTLEISLNEENKLAKMINDNIKRINIFFKILFVVIVSLIMITPLEFHSEGQKVFSSGISTDVCYVGIVFFVISWIISIISNHKHILNKKYIPLFVFMVIVGVLMLVRTYRPDVLLISSFECFISVLMYFTIENPDVKMIEQLEIAKEQADKANNAKSDFLSNMSHEIRTPLNAIVGFSENLKDQNIPADAKENVNDIIMASNNLLDIVNGILDISKIEANKLEIIDKEYDIKSVLDELIALTKARIGDKGLDFRVNIDPGLPRILYGDNVRIKQVILNILTNAVKYTKEGYVIFTVSSVVRNGVCRLIVSVEDSGIGIKEESIPKLFSKFERLDVEKEITIEGTGLGLAITKRLVELMHGTIVVQSVYGKGSKFTISIDQRVIATEPRTIEKSPLTTSKFVDAKGSKILVVDDNELNLKVAGVLLKKYHFDIDTATNGVECLNKIRNGNEYDIIFMDDMMPRMNGREALAKLKENENFHTPVIALTANAITGMKEEYLNCGFNDYLPKPIETKELERIIKEYISKKRSDYVNTNMSRGTNSIIGREFNINIQTSLANEPKQEENKNEYPKRVLVVDDNEMNLKIALNALKKYDIKIDKAMSGSEAISKVIENKYDLILLDEMMPELDGCKTLENFRDIEGFATPTIMMTASSEDEVKDKLEKYKFDGYLSKPFNKDELDKVIRDILK